MGEEPATGAVSRPGAVSFGVVGHEADTTGGAIESGRMSGDIAAAPAHTGVISGCTASWFWPTGAGPPGSRGADTSVGAMGTSPICRWPCPSSGPAAPRRRCDSGAVAAPAPGVRIGVTLLPGPEPTRASVVSPGAPVDIPPSAIAASDTAPAATNANRSPREADRSAS